MNDSDAYERLAAEVQRDFPESWKPEPGEVLVGEYVRRDTGTSSYDGSSVPIIVLRDREGQEHGVWIFHAVLRQQLAEKRPRVGELVAIRYAGKRQGRSGSSYHDWKVAVDRDESDGGEWATEPGDADAAADVAAAPMNVAAPPQPADDDIPF